MARFIVEGGIYLLIFFTPFAFGGVELWAQGVLQIVAGLVVAAGAWGLLAAPAASSLQTRRGLRLLPLWIPLGLFVLLALLQLTPLPASWLRSVSPSAHTLYASTIPGYAEGAPFEPADIAAWVLERHAARIPEPGAESPPDDLLRPPVHAASIAGPLPAGRTISIAPFETRQRLVLLCCLIGLFAVTLHFYDSRERIARLAAACVAAATVLSMVGILQKLTGGGRLLWLRSVDSLTTFGPFVNRNNYAAFAGLFFPVALSLTLAELGRVRERRRNALPRLLLWGFASVTCGAGIFFSLSRGGILAAGLSILILAGFLVYFGRQAAEIAMLAVILAACAGFLFWI
ncbi:MAG TPA: hypothetical protein VFP98_10455, partial [Candidatus Polarisedimenticolia bacterium]|nr:hypothetical protein [Candidatus Polarisedimenticolia bacterium]